MLKGPVVRVEWVNPHTWIHLEVTDDSGNKEVWMVEGGTPNSLLRRGLKRDTIKIGQIVVVDGYQAKGPLQPRQRARRDFRGRAQVLLGLLRHGRTVRQGTTRPIAVESVSAGQGTRARALTQSRNASRNVKSLALNSIWANSDRPAT